MWAKLRYAHLLNLARRSQKGAEKSPARWLVGGLAALLLRWRWAMWDGLPG